MEGQSVVKETVVTIIECSRIMVACFILVLVGPGYLLAVVGGILHAQQVSVGPSVQVTVFSANATVAGVSRLALAAKHGLGEDTQVDAVCIFVAVVATILAGIAGFANLGEKMQRIKEMQAESVIVLTM